MQSLQTRALAPVVLMSLALATACSGTRRESTHESAGASSGTLPDSGAVAAVRFASFTTTSASARLESATAMRAYVTEGVAHLSEAVDEVVEIVSATESLPPGARDRANELRAAATEMRGDSTEAPRVSTVRVALLSAAGAVTALQKDRYPHLDRAAFQVRLAARRVSAREPIMLQQAALRRFFERASDALLAMHP